MKPDKAIEILKDLKHAGRHSDHPNGREAIQLGIEALDRIQEHRRYKLPSSSIPLPGETKE